MIVAQMSRRDRQQRPSQQAHQIGLIMRAGFGRRSADAVSALVMLPLGASAHPIRPVPLPTLSGQ